MILISLYAAGWGVGLPHKHFEAGFWIHRSANRRSLLQWCSYTQLL